MGCADLVSCCKVAPAVAPFSGMSWAHIPPPPPPPPVVPSAACVANRKKCSADKACAPLMKLDSIKATKKAGCQKSKGLLDLWFALTSTCPNTKYPGFQDNIPMWKEQITDMPVYKDTGTTGRFKANKGAGSICNMVSELVDGFAAGFPDSASAPVASKVYATGKWSIPDDGWKGAELIEAQKGEAAKAAAAKKAEASSAKVEAKWRKAEDAVAKKAAKLSKAQRKLDVKAK